MTKVKFQSFWEKFGTLCILICMFIAFSIASPEFFPQPTNLLQCLLQSTVYIFLAFGEFFAILFILGSIRLDLMEFLQHKNKRRWQRGATRTRD